MFQYFDKWDIIDKRYISLLGKLTEQSIFQLTQFSSVLCSLLHQLLSLSFELRSFVTHNFIKKLITETKQSNIEVNNHSLGKCLRAVVRVRDLGGQEHAEVGVPVDLLVTHFDDFNTGLNNDVLFKDRVDKRIKFLINILEKNRGSESDSHLKFLRETILVERQDRELFFAVLGKFLILNPGNSLHLRIDTERESAGKVSQNTILNREIIRWQTFGCPLGHLNIVGQEFFQGECLSVRNILLYKVLLPVLEEHLFSKHKVKWTTV
mmetsp:Transcript_27920/g.37824  ORF Transcript_27920/g.37824 Transcript_27920/m.37824 type:complete len:265 (-) Transcript_27920:2935-3729(-)